MSEINAWAPLAADNNAAPPDGAPETTMTIRAVNDTLRELYAALRRYHDDSGLVTGTLASGVLTINGARTLGAYYSGLTVQVVPDIVNTGPITARYKSLAAKPVTKAGAALAAGDLPANVPARLGFHNEAWHLLSMPGTAVSQAALDAAASGLRAELRVPVGGLLITLDSTNPATLLGYGTWAQEQFGTILCDGSYQDVLGNSVVFTLGQRYGSFYVNPWSYANAVPQHQHAIADHTHAIDHGHAQTGHSHIAPNHAHAIEHAHAQDSATMIEVPFGTANSARLKLTTDNNNVITIQRASLWPGGVWTGAPTVGQSGGMEVATTTDNASIQAISQQSGARALTTNSNAPSGQIPAFGAGKAFRVWRRTA